MSYHIGQACLNGHAITGNASSEFASRHCEQCGAATIHACPGCKGPIRGYLIEGYSWVWNPPAHCHACGSAMPWTAARLEAVSELADAIDELTAHERDVLRELMPHLVQETPRTQPAGFKVATILGTMKGPGKTALRKLIEELAVEAGKKALGF